MNYSEMTDFEINCAVARALGMAHAFFFSKSEDDFCEGIEPNQRGQIWQSKEYLVNGYRVSNGNCFNPCNSWSDAGPIIEKNHIDIIWYELDACWGAHNGMPCAYDKRPQRAAMIVFLKMQEKPNAA